MQTGDIELYFSRDVSELGTSSGVFHYELADGTAIVPDKRNGGRMILPARHAHMVDRFLAAGFITADERKERQRQAYEADLARIEREAYPLDVRGIIQHAREHGIGLEVRDGKLWVNAPDGMDMVFARCLQHRRTAVIRELERRAAAWVEVA